MHSKNSNVYFKHNSSENDKSFSKTMTSYVSQIAAEIELIRLGIFALSSLFPQNPIGPNTSFSSSLTASCKRTMNSFEEVISFRNS